MRNPVPRKGIGTRIFGGKTFYYAGRTIYPSKARLVALELAEKGIKSRITERRDMGSMIWVDTPRIWLDLSEPIYNPLTSSEKKEIKNWANMQYGIAQRYQDDLIRSAFWRGRSVGMGKVAQVYNPRGQAGAHFTGNPVYAYCSKCKKWHRFRTRLFIVHDKYLTQYRTKKPNPVIKPPPGYRYFDNRPTKIDAEKLGRDLEKQGYVVAIAKGKYAWHVFVKSNLVQRRNIMTKPVTGIKLIPPSPNSGKPHPSKGLYPSLFSKITKKDRENAARKGVII